MKTKSVGKVHQNLEIIDFNGSQKSEISDETGRFV